MGFSFDWYTISVRPTRNLHARIEALTSGTLPAVRATGADGDDQRKQKQNGSDEEQCFQSRGENPDRGGLHAVSGV